MPMYRMPFSPTRTFRFSVFSYLHPGSGHLPGCPLSLDACSAPTVFCPKCSAPSVLPQAVHMFGVGLVTILLEGERGGP